jgi:hypothetical protein
MRGRSTLAFMKKRESREVWQERVAQWAESGQTAREFAEANGFNIWTLRGWRERLVREARTDRKRAVAASRTAERRKRRRTDAKRALPFVELVASAGLEQQPEDRFEIVLSDARTLRVPRHFDAQALRQLLAVLDAR